MASTARRKASPASFLLKLREVLAREDPAVISWDGDGRITIGDPKRLGDEVLARYFRHGNFSSFQRQLNYFGYYKVQGKGRLAACVYTNDALAAAAGGPPDLPVDALLALKRKSSRERAPPHLEALLGVRHVALAAELDAVARLRVAALAELLLREDVGESALSGQRDGGRGGDSQ